MFFKHCISLFVLVKEKTELDFPIKLIDIHEARFTVTFAIISIHPPTSSGAVWNDRPEGAVSDPLSPTSVPSDFFLDGGCGLTEVIGGVEDNVSRSHSPSKGSSS